MISSSTSPVKSVLLALTEAPIGIKYKSSIGSSSLISWLKYFEILKTYWLFSNSPPKCTAPSKKSLTNNLVPDESILTKDKEACAFNCSVALVWWKVRVALLIGLASNESCKKEIRLVYLHLELSPLIIKSLTPYK